jgi:hypothetical protein
LTKTKANRTALGTQAGTPERTTASNTQTPTVESTATASTNVVNGQRMKNAFIAILPRKGSTAAQA